MPAMPSADGAARSDPDPVALGRVTPEHLPAPTEPSTPSPSEPEPAVTPVAAAVSGPPAARASVDRQEFVRAFVAQSWARPGGDRPVARVHVTLMVTMGAVAVAVVIGVALQMLHPIPLSTPVAAAVPQVSSAPKYSAVSGWDCGTGADRGFDVTGRTADWHTAPRGGWAHDGCHGTFEAIPMSGDAHKSSENVSAVWWFKPAADINRCTISVYLPAAEQPADSAATAAQFFVTAGPGGGRLASFTLDETAARGAWRSAGTYPVSQGGIAVQLVNQGVPAQPAARLAVTQVRVMCTG
ncbi:hypothetical protein [Dactylosporangium sp. NPDC048998]|uniref:hypothetical protein n=1 Tax=Dactylosporangium sp. NPDC048998 TaxID=3363976 RepID=UPI0037175F22